MTHARVFLRGLLMVALVACNTRQLASGHLLGAVPIAFCISLLWWGNSSKDRPAGRGMGAAYAAGAACGTVVGYGLAAVLAL